MTNPQPRGVDEEPVRKMERYILEQAGFHVVEAADGAAAIAALHV